MSAHLDLDRGARALALLVAELLDHIAALEAAFAGGQAQLQRLAGALQAARAHSRANGARATREACRRFVAVDEARAAERRAAELARELAVVRARVAALEAQRAPLRLVSVPAPSTPEARP